jgi:hypothetical protein
MGYRSSCSASEGVPIRPLTKVVGDLPGPNTVVEAFTIFKDWIEGLLLSRHEYLSPRYLDLDRRPVCLHVHGPWAASCTLARRVRLLPLGKDAKILARQQQRGLSASAMPRTRKAEILLTYWP